jgi:hypothetical protein
VESSLCEKPERHAPRRLSDHLVLEGQKQKVHSLVDKVYSRENLKLAWERVRANQGASGADRVTIEDFEAGLDENLDRLHRELREQTYQPQAVRRLEIPKRGAMTGFANRPWSIVWNRSLKRSLIRVALGIAKAARRPTPWARSGVKWGPEASGSSMRI